MAKRPINIYAGGPRTLSDLSVNWAELVGGTELGGNNYCPYVEAIARYTNGDGVPDQICLIAFELNEDDQFTKALQNSEVNIYVESELVALFLTRTKVFSHLYSFSKDPRQLEILIKQVNFKHVSPFHVVGELAGYLYHYGMYQHFYDAHSMNEAETLAQQFLVETVGSNLEYIYSFSAWGPWGDWFDKHSCTDRTFILFNPVAGTGVLLVCSHSD